MINIDGKQIKLQIWDTVSQVLAREKHLATICGFICTKDQYVSKPKKPTRLCIPE